MSGSVNKWARLYLKDAPGQGHIVLATQRRKPQKKNGATWAVVNCDRRVATLNVNDRERVHARRPKNTNFADFPALPRPEKTQVVPAAGPVVWSTGILARSGRRGRIRSHHVGLHRRLRRGGGPVFGCCSWLPGRACRNVGSCRA